MTHQQAIAARLAQLRREKSARDERDIGQKELAEWIGCTPETYSRYENGRRKVPHEAVMALAKYYGVPAGFISFGETPPEPRVTYGGKIPNDEAVGASRERAAKRAADPPAATRKAAGGKRRRGRPTDDQ